MVQRRRAGTAASGHHPADRQRWRGVHSRSGGHRRSGRRLAGAVALVLPAAVTLAWVPIRAQLPTVDVALALVLAVATCGATARRWLVVLAAAGAVAGFAYFDTRPYEHWVVSRQPDIETLVALVVVSLVTGELAVRVTRLRSADPSAQDMDRVREIAALVASGAELVDVLGAVGTEMARLLGGSSSSYEAGESPSGALVVGRDGVTARASGADREPGTGGRLEVPVTGMGQVLGRFIVTDPPSGLRRARLLVALTLADQAGAALIAQAPETAASARPEAATLRPVLRVVD